MDSHTTGARIRDNVWPCCRACGKQYYHALSVGGLGMSNFSEPAVKEAGGGLDTLHLTNSWRAIVPVAVTALLALTPAPAGLAQHAWYYFAVFAGVIVALISEPLPGAAVGLIGVAVVTALAPAVLYGPAELAKPGFNPAWQRLFAGARLLETRRHFRPDLLDSIPGRRRPVGAADQMTHQLIR
jgi:hypothetical protein